MLAPCTRSAGRRAGGISACPRCAINAREKMPANIVNRLAEVAAILDEILRRIFIEGHKCFIAPLHGDPTRYLLAISQTCSWFRNISLSCSLLWARVYVEWSPKQRQFWVQRSGRVELDICAHTRRQIIHTSSDIFTAFYRWRSLCFTEILPETVAYILHNVAPIGMPGCSSLQSIDIRCLLVGASLWNILGSTGVYGPK